MNTDELLRALLFLPEAATHFADSIDHLHFFVISVTMFGAAIVFLVALWFALRYRRTAEPSITPRVRASKKLEFLFISGLLGLFILWWVIGFRQYIAYATPPVDAQDVYVTAKQWMWKFAYPDGRATVGVLVVPVDRNIRLVMTSRDVIHSFYVPAFRVKQDLLPGRYTTAWFEARREGIYDVYCAEYCGLSHSRMWASVAVLSAEDYARWLGGEEPDLLAFASARAAREDQPVMRVGARTLSMAEQGRQVASKHGCFACHTLDGQAYIGPTWRGLFGRVVELQSGEEVVADEGYLTRSMMDPRADLVRGYPAVMPPYLGLLRQPEAAAIVELIKSLDEPPPEPSAPLPSFEIVSADRSRPRRLEPPMPGAVRRDAAATGASERDPRKDAGAP